MLQRQCCTPTMYFCLISRVPCCCCRGVDSSAQELSGLQAEKEGLQQELSALQTIHAEGLQSSTQEAASLRKVRITFQHLLTAECMRANASKPSAPSLLCAPRIVLVVDVRAVLQHPRPYTVWLSACNILPSLKLHMWPSLSYGC